jgi:trk system potassium uptake protein TrkA
VKGVVHVLGEFVVIGLGIFGRVVASSLARENQSVLAIDINDDEVNKMAAELDTVVRADATDEGALRELRVERMSCAVVAIGAQSMEASILTTALLRQMGVPHIIARSFSTLHARVLRAVGAHEVVSPEEEMGRRLAYRLSHPNILERFDLGEHAQIAEVEVPAQFVGKTLVETDVRRRYELTVVAIHRGADVIANPDRSQQLRSDDVLVVVGTPEAVAGFATKV